MRIYYVFKIKEEVYSLYEKTPSVLFSFFNYLYHTKKEDLDYGSIIFNQIANKVKKEELDLKIYIKFHNKLIYSKKGEEHIINNLYKNEISIMKIKKSYIVINTNRNYTEFFNILNDLSTNFIACDFNNQDYFYLNKLKSTCLN